MRCELSNIAFLSQAVACACSRPGVVAKPLDEESPQLRTYLALRADEGSRLTNEFARAFLRKCCGPDSDT